MDADQFDRLTKALARGTSRRRLLEGLGSALAGALARGGEAAAAGVRASCSSDADCIDSRCINGHRRLGVGAGGQCGGDGHPCTAHQACCAGLVCTPGALGAARCAPSPSNECLPDYERCSENASCCNGHCSKNNPLGREARCTPRHDSSGIR